MMLFHIVTIGDAQSGITGEIKLRDVRGIERAMEFAKHYTQKPEDDYAQNRTAMAYVIRSYTSEDVQDRFGSILPRDVDRIGGIVISGEVIYYNDLGIASRLRYGEIEGFGGRKKKNDPVSTDKLLELKNRFR